MRDVMARAAVALRVVAEPPVRDASAPGALRLSVVPFSTDGNSWIEGGGGGVMVHGAVDAGRGAKRAFVLVSVRDQQRIELRCADAVGEWEVLEAVDSNGKLAGESFWTRAQRNKRHVEDGVGVEWTLPATRGGASVVEAFDNVPGYDRQMVAIDAEGKEHASRSVQGVQGVQGVEELRASGPVGSQTRGVFAGLPLERIARFELRGQRHAAAIFADVSLRPGFATQPRVQRDVKESGPADRLMDRALTFDSGEPLMEVLESIAQASGAKIDVHWRDFAEYQRLSKASKVARFRLAQASAVTAVRAAIEAAGGRDFTVVVSADGQTIRVAAGQFHLIRGDQRPASVPRR